MQRRLLLLAKRLFYHHCKRIWTVKSKLSGKSVMSHLLSSSLGTIRVRLQ